ncbi:MAG: ABC transporter transmembrane domain-containing protein, partial [Angustibacter sp.]
MTIGSAKELSVWGTLRRGLAVSPELRIGLGLTLALAGIGTLGRIVVPVAVQQTIDNGLRVEGGPRVEWVIRLLCLAALVVLLTALCSNAVNRRLFRAAESGLASLRIAAFRRVHDLSVLTQNAERRGSLVARVTSDVDTISSFVQFGGLMLILAVFQLLVATGLMLWYSPLLTLVVWLCFLPVFLAARPLQGAVSRAYGQVRERVAAVFTVVSESVVGAATIRAYGVADRTADRVDRAVT